MGEARCLRWAEAACGVLSRAEVLQHLTVAQLKWRVKTGRLVRVFPNVFRVAGAPDDFRQTLVALKTWAGPKRATLSGETAAFVHGFRGFTERSTALEVTARVRIAAPDGVTAHRGELLARDVVVVDGFRVTSVARTVLDLAPRLDRVRLRDLVQQALREKKTTLEALGRALEQAEGRPGTPALRALVHELNGDGGPTESVLEDKALQVLDAFGLPRPVVQRRVKVRGKRSRIDLLYEREGVVVEVDGYAFHSDVESFERDRERQNRLASRGWRVLRWTWKALHDRPDELAFELGQVLGALSRAA